MDVSVKESKDVVLFLKKASSEYNLTHEKRISFAKLSEVFINASQISGNIIYCLAAVNSFLKKTSSNPVTKMSKCGYNEFTAAMILEPDPKEIEELNGKYSFSCKAGDLYIERPDWTPNFSKLI